MTVAIDDGSVFAMLPRHKLRRWPDVPDVAGVDEAGCAPLAGPVVVAAVILDPARRINGLDDSKVLPEATREKLYARIVERARAWSVVAVEAEEIDRINIFHARMAGMLRALNLLASAPAFALIDGNHLPRPLLCPARALVAGDALAPAISAASIIAKVTRDRIMREMDARWPGYGFAQHKGYPTPLHVRALHRLGPCPQHRRSYAPVRAALAQNDHLLRETQSAATLRVLVTEPCPWAHRILLSVALLCLGLRAGFAATPCVQGVVSVDPAHRSVSLRLTFPAGVDGLDLDAYYGYQRAQLWHSPDGTVRVKDDTVALTDPTHRTATLLMDVQRNIGRADRSYRPFLRFGDGSIAVYSGNFATDTPRSAPLCLQYIAAPGEEVIGYGQVSQHAIRATDRSGYIVFGHLRIVKAGGLTFVIDRAAPEWIKQRVASEVPAVNHYYTQELWPVTQPIVILWAAPKLEGFNGDHLDASITMGVFGSDWKTPNKTNLDTLLHFVSHELFHSWNAGDSFPAAGETGLLASEGGADAGATIAQAVAAGRPANDTWLHKVGSAYNACRAELSERKSLAARLREPSPNRLPYDCGQAVLFTLAASTPERDPVATYFSMWRHLHAHRPAHPYTWRDLVPRNANPATIKALVLAIDGAGAFGTETATALEADGYEVRPDPNPTPAERTAAARKLTAWAMQEDCDGRISFWTKPDGFLLDPSVHQCKSLRPGKKVVGMLGKNLRVDPWKIDELIRARCANHQSIIVDYKAHAPPSRLTCHAAPKAIPHPVSILPAARR